MYRAAICGVPVEAVPENQVRAAICEEVPKLGSRTVAWSGVVALNAVLDVAHIDSLQAGATNVSGWTKAF